MDSSKEPIEEIPQILHVPIPISNCKSGCSCADHITDIARILTDLNIIMFTILDYNKHHGLYYTVTIDDTKRLFLEGTIGYYSKPYRLTITFEMYRWIVSFTEINKPRITMTNKLILNLQNKLMNIINRETNSINKTKIAEIHNQLIYPEYEYKFIEKHPESVQYMIMMNLIRHNRTIIFSDHLDVIGNKQGILNCFLYFFYFMS